MSESVNSGENETKKGGEEGLDHKHDKSVQRSADFASGDKNYCLKILMQRQFLGLLEKENHIFIGIVNALHDGSPFALTGKFKVNHTDIWIVNEASGYIVLWLNSRKDAEILWKYIFDNNNVLKPSRDDTIFEYSEIMLQITELGGSIKLEARPCDLLSSDAIDYLFEQCVERQIFTFQQGKLRSYE